jgi:hypothetical protein
MEYRHGSATVWEPAVIPLRQPIHAAALAPWRERSSTAACAESTALQDAADSLPAV